MLTSDCSYSDEDVDFAHQDFVRLCAKAKATTTTIGPDWVWKVSHPFIIENVKEVLSSPYERESILQMIVENDNDYIFEKFFHKIVVNSLYLAPGTLPDGTETGEKVEINNCYYERKNAVYYYCQAYTLIKKYSADKCMKVLNKQIWQESLETDHVRERLRIYYEDDLSKLRDFIVSVVDKYNVNYFVWLISLFDLDYDLTGSVSHMLDCIPKDTKGGELAFLMVTCAMDDRMWNNYISKGYLISTETLLTVYCDAKGTPNCHVPSFVDGNALIKRLKPGRLLCKKLRS